jgi:hypothetical protein
MFCALCVYTCLLSLVAITSSIDDAQKSHGLQATQEAPGVGEQDYILNPEKIDILLHTAAMMTLLEVNS